MKRFLLLFLASSAILFIAAKKSPCYLNGFTQNEVGEQRMVITGTFPDVRMVVNAPSPEQFDKAKKTALVVYALPNGNTIEWTAGKRMQDGDDWHYGIQNIGAQMRFIRATNADYNWVVAYLETSQKSWPAWSREHADSGKALIQQMVDSLLSIFVPYHPVVMLNGHSGGGRFIFDYISGPEAIPAYVERIAFLDSEYGYEDTLHRQKLVDWLKGGDNRFLDVIAYNDSVVIYNGKPLVSPTGGTWYRSWKMQRDLSPYFNFQSQTDTAFITHNALDGRIQFHLKQNPNGQIYHTVLVERNGFIHTLLSGTKYENSGYEFWGERAYNSYTYDVGY